jgi:hypothetical protein
VCVFWYLLKKRKRNAQRIQAFEPTLEIQWLQMSAIHVNTDVPMKKTHDCLYADYRGEPQPCWKSSRCHTVFYFLFNIFQFSVFILVYLPPSFLSFVCFCKTERNSAVHEPSCLCLPFHLSMLSAWLIYGHLFWLTRTRCRTREWNYFWAVIKVFKKFLSECRSESHLQ